MTLPAVGIIGTGALGGAIARGLLDSGEIAPDRLWLANRRGRAEGFAQNVRISTDLQAVAEASDLLLLAVPPGAVRAMRIEARDRLVVSVMAGVTIERLKACTGAARIVRAMSNPAAAIRLAYSPWCTAAAVTPEDRIAVTALFTAIGMTDEVPNEEQIDRFTALTGPVPGFVAYYAQCMVDDAVRHGIDPAIATRAIRQLFHAGGVILANDPLSPTEQVEAMIAYAGTTAAGLKTMRAGPLARAISAGLDAAAQKARTIAEE